MWCSYCAKDQQAERDEVNGFTCCTGCGRVLDDNVFSSEPTFCKGSAGQSQLSGNIVRAGQYSSHSRLNTEDGSYTYQSASHEKTLDRGRNEIRDIADSLSISGRDDAVGAAHRLYVLAVEKSFTKGRRTQQVAAACLYIVCRQDNKPYLLIDFSDSLQVNVYVLGAVFLQLCALLRLEQHAMLQRPVDPSLFIHRFTDRLLGLSNGSFGRKHHQIANTALRIVASMKRDWIQTGRRPSGICGAALFVSAHIHGFECSKGDVVSVVHVCETTLTKRLLEFGSTESGGLTPEEFEVKAREMEAQVQRATQPVVNLDSKGLRAITEILCEHKELGAAHYAHGLCKSCYDEFIKVSGGLEGESEPPSFQRAERKRIAEERRKLKKFLLEEPEEERRAEVSDRKGKRKIGEAEEVEEQEVEEQEQYRRKGKSKLDLNRLAMSEQVLEDFQILDSGNEPAQSTLTDNYMASQDSTPGAEETLSDIDDDEMSAYLNNDDEVRLKTIVWTEMNKEYIQELEAKEAAIAASEAAQAAALSAISGSGTAAEIAAAAAAAVANTKKVRKSKRGEKKPPAESAAEAARQMLESKKLSSRVNFNVLEKLFDGQKESTQETKSSPKRVRFADKKETAKVADDTKEDHASNVDEENNDENPEAEAYEDNEEPYEEGPFEQEEEYYEEY